jgi:hypothetical protein
MFIRQQGKYSESGKNWILLMNIHMVLFWILFIAYFMIPVELKTPAMFILGGLIISFAIQVFAFAINPGWFKSKQTKELDEHG